MKILVAGSGAREHALVWKISRSESVETVYAFPGNAGIEEIAHIPDIENSIESICRFAVSEGIDLVVIGPEAYLAEGLSDALIAKNIKVCGVNKKAAQLESSKAFAKDLMQAASIPTAGYVTVNTFEDGKKALAEMNIPVVLKADGLAAGKGVVIAQSIEEAERELKEMLEGKFSDAGKKIVIEEFLDGEELSLLLFVDGSHYMPLQFSQDHKAAYDGDTGPNTGGMGAYTPVSIGTDTLYSTVEQTIVKPLIETFKKNNIDYRGILYIGLMIVDGTPYVLEFNVRFGDPETEPLLFQMKSDIVPYLAAVHDGALDTLAPISWHDSYGVSVVLASGGYPGSYEKGKVIKGLDSVDNNTVVFHAGTKRQGDDFVTSGGRVLMVTSRGTTCEEAIKNVYSNVEKISFDGAFYRQDIGHRENKRVK